ncbi:MAG: ImmA/IrrE family metallo-endopeptidase [Hyphomicrobiaceae bacterium]|nr:ImmA/IrrE family metallo-endopeptidase [Hyphomicrobiaceae bacterium]
MSSSYPEAIREGTAAAARLHLRLKTRRLLPDGIDSVDVVSAALDLGVSILFRPLKGLLGAFLPLPAPGILITTERPLRIQRFTAAHEVGHYFMKHQPSLDDEGILRRGMFTALPLGSDFQEVEANAFAASFLMPTWLVAHHCKRHGWIGPKLRPENIYQLALRLGASYEATCWTLGRYRMISTDDARAFAAIAPRTFKTALLGDVRPTDYRGDVWLLTDNDHRTLIAGSPNDLFVMQLNEHSGSGYLWDYSQLESSGFAILRNGHLLLDQAGVGSPGVREIISQAGEAPFTACRLVERRPWLPHQPLQTLDLRFDLRGAEQPGFSRAERRRLLEAA